MITRVFTGRTHAGLEAAFERDLRDHAVPRFRSHPGVVDVLVGTPTDESPRDFLVVTVWRDLDALRGFAGPAWNRVVTGAVEREVLAAASVAHFRDGGDRDDIEALRRLAAREVVPRGLGAYIDVGCIAVDLRARRVHMDQRPVDLPPLEFSLLTELASRPGVPIPSAEIARRLWPGSALASGDDVRRSVYRLRRLLGDHARRPPLIRNRRGFGYVLEPDGARRRR